MIASSLLHPEDSGFGAIAHPVTPSCSLPVSAVLIASRGTAVAITLAFPSLCHSLTLGHWACIGDEEGKVQRTCLLLKD